MTQAMQQDFADTGRIWLRRALTDEALITLRDLAQMGAQAGAGPGARVGAPPSALFRAFCNAPPLNWAT